MADIFVLGKLLLDGKQLKVQYKNRNGRDVAPLLGSSVMSAGVARLSADRRDGTEVEVVLKPDQNPKLVRLAGESVTEAATVVTESSSGKGKRSGQQHGGRPQGGRPSQSQNRPQQSRRQSQPQQGTQPTARTYPAADCFHNSSNFVPALDRDSVSGDLGDSLPLGHHCLFDDHYTGWLEVTLTTATPLLLPDAANVKLHGQHNDHKKFPIRKGLDGKPYLHPASVKGVLSSAYEAITNSRLRVFAEHEGRLGMRLKAEQGVLLVPAQIANGQIQLLSGTAPIGSGGTATSVLHAAWLPRYDARTGSIAAVAKRFTGSSVLPAHGETVGAWLELYQHYSRKPHERLFRPNFRFWKVVQVEPTSFALPTAPPTAPVDPGLPDLSSVPQHDLRSKPRSSHRPVASVEPALARSQVTYRANGFVFVTNRNMNNVLS